jgi:hypothetical protein
MAETTGEQGSSEASAARLVAASLVLGGILLIAVAVYLGATVSPVLYLISVLSLVDFALARAFATGRIGPTAARRRAAEQTGDVAAEAELDPSYNPYARED